MPKKYDIIDRFDGGQNNVSDHRDIAENEAELLEGFVSDIPGQLRTMGKEASQSQTLTGFQSHDAAGLFHTLVDRNRAGTEQETEWLLSVDKDTGIVGVLEYASIGGEPAAGTWNGALSPTMDLGTTSVKGVFHTFDGVVRGCNGNFANGTPKWNGYIKRTKFTGSGAVYTDDEWWVTPPTLAPPLSLAMVDDDNAAVSNLANFTLQIANTMEHAAGEDNYLWKKVFEGAVSYVYDGNQESLLTVSSNNLDNTGLAGDPVLSRGTFALYMTGHTADYNSSNFDKRITHVKFYLREQGTEDWFLQGVYDLDAGGGLPYSETKEDWAYAAAVNGLYWAANTLTNATENFMAEPLMEHTYLTETGHLPSEKAIDIGNSGDGWKASAVLNRQVYLFGVKATDEDGKQIENGDMILVSEPNQPDKFLRGNALISVTGDGDHIVGGLAMADRLFSFKRKSMKVLNIAQSAFIEDETVQEGVDDVDKYILTDYGVVWVNPNGLFLHNGKQYIELFKKRIEGKLEPFIDNDWFNTNIYASGSCGLAYNKYEQQLIISGYTNGKLIIYDLASGSVSYGIGRIGTLSSNFIQDIKGNSLFLADSTNDVVLQKFDFDEQNYTDPKYWGKRKDFGAPGVKKYIYDVVVGYRNSGSLLNDNVELYLDGVSNVLNGTMLAGQNTFVDASYTFSEIFKECESAQVRISSSLQMPSFSVYQTDKQTGILNQTNTKLTWDVEEWDTHGNFAGNTFTPSVAGKYLFTGHVWLESGNIATTNFLVLLLYKNGSKYKEATYKMNGTSNFQGPMLSVTADANGTTDYFELYIHQVTGVTKSTVPASEVSAVKYYTWWQGIGLSTNDVARSSFSVYQDDAGQSGFTSGAYVKTQWDFEEWDINSEFALGAGASNSRFTPTVEGYYYFDAHAWLQTGSITAGDLFALGLFKNGDIYKQAEFMFPGTGNFRGPMLSCTAYANGSGDYFECHLYQLTGGSKSTLPVSEVQPPLSNYTYFQGHLISPADSPMPTFSAYQVDAGQAGILDSTYTKLLFANTEWNVLSDFAGSTFTPTVAGKYLLIGRVWLKVGSIDAGELLSIQVFKNGEQYKQAEIRYAGTGAVLNFEGPMLSVIVDANGTGDYFELYINQWTGVTKNTLTTAEVPVEGNRVYTWFQAVGIGGGISTKLRINHIKINKRILYNARP
ncbi:hypothetical protein LCGC14_0364750 [marine sediment metagenome]|uniref:Uncharacterized protein n=1 Tax=marine sediment metagenome TaxID=412755 RepID=A0A0F9WFC6_9ZZZZ